MSEVTQQDRAREVLAATPHTGDCPELMSDWDKGMFTANELADMQCDCGRVPRAMLAFAATHREEAARNARRGALKEAVEVVRQFEPRGPHANHRFQVLNDEIKAAIKALIGDEG